MVAAVRSLPIPAPDEVPPADPSPAPTPSPSGLKLAGQSHHMLMVPISSRSQSYDASPNLSPSHPTFTVPSASPSLGQQSGGTPSLRTRSKTLASLTTSSQNSLADMSPLELHLPKDSSVNGQPIEAYLYKDAMECPICFLYYPPHLNRTRCCDQSICSECFVQIKRPDPHPPDHGDPGSPTTAEGFETSEVDADSNLVSEPAACPFCVQPEFGIIYDPPPFRRGLIYVNHPSAQTVASAASAMSSSSSLSSFSGNGGLISQTNHARRRTTSMSATAPNVITTDRVRPDWAQKLSSARAHAARRSAAATALHTAAYLMGNGAQGTDPRGFAGFGRRTMLRRGSGADSPSSGMSSMQLNALALLAERHGASGARNEMNSTERGPTMLAPPPRGSSRRNRIEDLEDMMMMEAIRLSLASEEERRKKEDKEAKKEAKKKGKEMKKAAKKGALYSNSANPSSLGLDGTKASFLVEIPNVQGKGKGIDRSGSGSPSIPTSSQTVDLATATSTSAPATGNLQSYLDQIHAQSRINDVYLPAHPSGCEPQKPSHLRQTSNASSSASSFAESAPGSSKNGLAGSSSSLDASPNTGGLHIPRSDTVSDTPGTVTPGGGAGAEPMFNFRSLSAMVDDHEKEKSSIHIEEIRHEGAKLDEDGMGQSSSHEFPEVNHGGNDLKLEQSTATVKAEGALQGSSGNGAIGTPDVMVTSPSETSFHCQDKSTSHGVAEIEVVEVDRSEKSHLLLLS